MIVFLYVAYCLVGRKEVRSILAWSPDIGYTGNGKMIGASSPRRQHGLWGTEMWLGLTSQRKKHGSQLRTLG